MGVFDNLGNAGMGDEISRVLGTSKDAAGGQAFQRSFKNGDFDDGVGGDVEATQFRTIASYQVPAGTELAWGYGSATNEANQGYIYALTQNATPAEVTGTLRLAYASTTQRGIEVVWDGNEEELHGDKSDRSMKKPLPEQVQKPVQQQDEYLLVQFKTDGGADTIDGANTDLAIPVTEYDLTVPARQ